MSSSLLFIFVCILNLVIVAHLYFCSCIYSFMTISTIIVVTMTLNIILPCTHTRIRIYIACVCLVLSSIICGTNNYHPLLTRCACCMIDHATIIPILDVVLTRLLYTNLSLVHTLSSLFVCVH
jgi:hypothetical protein